MLKKRITSIQGNINTSIQNNFNHDNIQGNINTSIQNNFNHDNKYNKKKKDILDKIYYVDDNGVEYWHGEPIESKEATIEEQEEIGRILESFREKEEI